MNAKDALRVLADALGFGESAAEQPFAFAAGVPFEVECARPGKFSDKWGSAVEFTPDSLVALASTLDPESALVKIGHVQVTDDYPNYGSITSARYDAGRERLLATVVPTPALVKKNRDEGFRRVSMELSGESNAGPWNLRNLAFLAAWKPAVDGLKPVDLSARAAGGEVTLCFSAGAEAELEFRTFDAKARKAAAKTGAAMPDGSFPIENQQDLENAIHAIGRASDPAAAKAHIKTRARALGLEKLIPAGWEGSLPLDTDENVRVANEQEEKNEMDEKHVAELAAANAAKDKAEAETKALRERLLAGAALTVKSFIAANAKRITLAQRKAGLEEGLIALLAAEIAVPTTFEFSVPGATAATAATTKKQSPFEFVTAMLAAQPEQTTAAEERETAIEGEPEAEPTAEFAGQNVDKGSVVVELAVRRVMKDAEARGQKLSYEQAISVVQAERDRATR